MPQRLWMTVTVRFPSGLSPHCNGSDCGYSSSMEGSETGSREGSDVACTEGICNHDENGRFGKSILWVQYPPNASGEKIEKEIPCLLQEMMPASIAVTTKRRMEIAVWSVGLIRKRITQKAKTKRRKRKVKL